MFTKGKIIFTIFFIIVFAIAMIWSYSRDKKHQKMYYKGIWKVALGIIIAIAIFATLTFWLHD
jgi:O-antigen/teichoic acid export membrane protein